MIHATTGVPKEKLDWRLEIKTEKDYNIALESGLAWVIFKDFPFTWGEAKKELASIGVQDMNRFNGYVGFLEWCAANGYEDDEGSEDHGVDRNIAFYIKKKGSDSYALVSVYRDYYKGWLEGVVKEGFIRREKQITVTEVVYEEVL